VAAAARPVPAAGGFAAGRPAGEQTRPWFAQDGDAPAPGSPPSVVAGNVISESVAAGSDPEITDAPSVVSASEVAGEAAPAATGYGTPAGTSNSDDPDTGDHPVDQSSSGPATESSADAGSRAAGNGAGQNGSSQDGSSRDGSAQRVFDVATTRRRAVIFEEDDDLDVPDFLK
jgi:cell division protein FtsZ